MIGGRGGFSFCTFPMETVVVRTVLEVALLGCVCNTLYIHSYNIDYYDVVRTMDDMPHRILECDRMCTLY